MPLSKRPAAPQKNGAVQPSKAKKVLAVKKPSAKGAQSPVSKKTTSKKSAAQVAAKKKVPASKKVAASSKTAQSAKRPATTRRSVAAKAVSAKKSPASKSQAGKKTSTPATIASISKKRTFVKEGPVLTSQPKKKTASSRSTTGSSAITVTAKKAATVKKAAALKKTPAKKSVKQPAEQSVAPKKAIAKTAAAGKSTALPAKKAVSAAVAAKKAPARKADETPIVLSKKSSKKSATGTQEHTGQGPRYTLDRDIAQTYGETRLEAIPRDPEWVYTYWEVTEQDHTKAVAHAKDSSARRVLRLNDVTDRHFDGTNAWHYHDTEVNGYADNWYIRVPEPGRSYIAELGLLNKKGHFVVIARSHSLTVPINSVSDNTSEQWDTVNTSQLIEASQGELGMGASRLGTMFETRGDRLPGQLGLGASDSYLGSGTNTL